MKKLKFRAWYKKEKALYLVSVIDFDNEEIMICQNNKNFCDILQMDEVEIMQSTWLTDKNGKEIFEGDIFSKTVYHDIFYEIEESSGIRIWKDEPIKRQKVDITYMAFYNEESVSFEAKIMKVNPEGVRIGRKGYSMEIAVWDRYPLSSFFEGSNKRIALGNIYENSELLNK